MNLARSNALHATREPTQIAWSDLVQPKACRKVEGRDARHTIPATREIFELDKIDGND